MPTLFPTHRIDDPRDLRVVAALQAVGAGRSTVQLPAMSTSFRDELRAQLVAVTPRLVEEGVRPGTETAARPVATGRRRSTTTTAAPARSPIRTRPMTVLVAGTAVVVLGLGGATWLARGALPGDALYGLKRTAEGVDVSMSGSQLDKGHAQLVSAQKRVAEVSALISRPQSMSLGVGTSAASGALSDGTVKLVVSTLQTADTDTQRGVTTIGDDAVTSGSTGGLELVAGWAGGTDGKGGQTGRIMALVARIPSGPAHDSAEAARANIETAYQRAVELLPEIQNGVTCARDRDQFGPKPCRAVTTPSVPTPSSSPAPGSGATSSNPGSAPTSGAPASSPAATPTGAGGSSRTSARRSPGAAASPRTSSSAPVVAIDSCGLQLPVAGVSLGACPPSS